MITTRTVHVAICYRSALDDKTIPKSVPEFEGEIIQEK